MAEIVSSVRPMARPDLADRALAAVVDHGGAEACAVAAVAFVDVLDHLLAPFVFEVDVDVGRFVAGLGHEAFEDHRTDFGRDGGDAEAVADHRVGGRAPALAEDAAGAGELDDVVDGEEVGFVPEFADQGELVLHERLDAVGRAGGVAPLEPGVGEAAEAFRGVSPGATSEGYS